MILAAPLWGGTETVSYKILLVVHIVMIVAAFGSVFAQSEVGRKIKAGSSEAAEVSVRLTTHYTLPALVSAVAAGIALVTASGGVWGFDETWISASLSVVLLLIVLAWFGLLPVQRSLVTETDAQTRKKSYARLSMTTGLFHLGFLIIVILMIWKPGG